MTNLDQIKLGQSFYREVNGSLVIAKQKVINEDSKNLPEGFCYITTEVIEDSVITLENGKTKKIKKGHVETMLLDRNSDLKFGVTVI